MSATDRPTVPNETCEHKVAVHYHGTHVSYVHDRCRCTDCSMSNARYEQSRAVWLAGVKPHPYTDARPVRAHVRSLMNEGMGLKHIAKVSGVPQGALWKLVYGKKIKGRQRPSKKVRRDTARKLFSVKLELADGARVPAGEAWRIVAELQARGWAKAAIARELGNPQAASLQLSRNTVEVGNLARLRELLYEEVPLKVHAPTGRTYRPKPKRPARDVEFTTPGVRMPAPAITPTERAVTERAPEPIPMAGRLACKVCDRPLAEHRITERCA